MRLSIAAAALLLSVVSCSSGDDRVLLPVDVTATQAMNGVSLSITVTGSTKGGVEKTFPGVDLGPGAAFKAGLYLPSGSSGALTIAGVAMIGTCAHGQGSVVTAPVIAGQAIPAVSLVLAAVSECPAADAGAGGDSGPGDVANGPDATGTGGSGTGGSGTGGSGSGGSGSGGATGTGGAGPGSGGATGTGGASGSGGAGGSLTNVGFSCSLNCAGPEFVFMGVRPPQTAGSGVISWTAGTDQTPTGDQVWSYDAVNRLLVDQIDQLALKTVPDGSLQVGTSATDGTPLTPRLNVDGTYSLVFDDGEVIAIGTNNCHGAPYSKIPAGTAGYQTAFAVH